MTRSDCKLSVCIGTFNRARFLDEALASIIPQMTNDCEIVISDNASTDDTQRVVADHAKRFSRLRCMRQEQNMGMDWNFDRVVELARGQYCWLFTDDDVMKPNAVARVLAALRDDPSLIIINAESRNFSLSRVLQRRWLEFDSDRVYGPDELERLFLEMDEASRVYMGNAIFRREIWLERERQRYYGSIFIRVGVIFQKPLPGATRVIAEPLVSYRMGNETSYSPQGIEMVLGKWPAVVASLALSEPVRKKIRSAEPWNHPRWLLFLRGWGRYSVTEYQRWIRPRLSSNAARLACIVIALLPGAAVNLLFVIYYSARRNRGHLLQLMSQSRYYLGNRRFFRRS